MLNEYTAEFLLSNLVSMMINIPFMKKCYSIKIEKLRCYVDFFSLHCLNAMQTQWFTMKFFEFAQWKNRYHICF